MVTTRTGTSAAAIPWVFTVATIGLQIAYPLVGGPARDKVTIGVVLLFFLASVSHCTVHLGARAALLLVAVTAVGGFTAEVIGVHSGVPFGNYVYTATLGPALLDVPLVVPLAWTMMAYPMLLAARRILQRLVFVAGGVGLAGWDVFLDPQMVRDGHWRWAHPSPSLPGIDTVPLTNYLGWLLVATAMMAVLNHVLPRAAVDDRAPAVLLLWTYAGSIVGNLFWFGTAGIAAAGAVAMGVVAVPYAWTHRRTLRRQR